MMVAPSLRGLKRVEGDTLIEVMVALLLLAVAVMSSVALQSWVAKSQQSARWLDIAVSTAAMVAEALRAGESPNTSLTLAGSVSAGLPEGQASLMPLGQAQWRIVVAWSEPPRWDGADQDKRGDDVSCPASKRKVGAGRVPRCISLVLVR